VLHLAACNSPTYYGKTLEVDAFRKHPIPFLWGRDASVSPTPPLRAGLKAS